MKPPLRAVTLKVDGSMMGSPPRAGFGGLCRVHHGSFLVGLYCHVGGQEILYAEI